MTRALVGSVVLVLALGSARAGEPVPLPRGMPPGHILISMKDGKLQLKQPVFVPERRKEVRTRTEVVNGKEVQVQFEVEVTFIRAVTREIRSAGARVFGVDGKAIEGRRLAELLKKERVGLLSGDQQFVEPFYLQTVREGTLIVVLPPGEPVPVLVPKGPAPP